MIIKLGVFLGLLCVNVSGGRVSRDVEYKNADDLDRSLIEQTGCKYVCLEKNETVWLKKTDLQHTVMATLLPEEQLRGQFRDPLENGFETHFAIRSTNEVQIHMFSGFRYLKYDKGPDFKIGFGSYDNRKSFMGFIPPNYEGVFYSSSIFKDTPTKDILSADKYAKLYIKIDEELKYGKHCERQPIDREDDFTGAPLEIVQFGFHATADDGAKILYDCPSNFAGCSCDWFVH